MKYGIAIILVLCALCIAGYIGYTDLALRREATTLKHRERVRLCNAQGNLYADGVCQRLYINLNRRL